MLWEDILGVIDLFRYQGLLISQGVNQAKTGKIKMEMDGERGEEFSRQYEGASC